VKLINEQFDGVAVNRNKQVGSTETENEISDEAKIERVEGTGVITRLDEAMPKGVIDRTYYFDIAQFCTGNHNFSQMCKVDFAAVRTSTSPAWTVVRMELHVSQKELDLKETLRRKELVVQVTEIDGENIFVRYENKIEKLPNRKEIMPPYKLMEGGDIIIGL
jgi:hypothetical protein